MKTYEDGLNDAWEVARKIACTDGYKCGELDNIFGSHSANTILSFLTASEAIDAIENYEGIKVGDEVTDDEEWKGVVTWINPNGEYMEVMLEDGTTIQWKKASFKKTGRHFPQIEEVLKQMKEG